MVPRQSQPTFLFVCKDGPDAPSLRSHYLEAHLRHVEDNWPSYVTAGPLRAPAHASIIGSALIVKADTLDDAWFIMNGDPYVARGVFDTIDVHDMTMSIGVYLGGKIWEDS